MMWLRRNTRVLRRGRADVSCLFLVLLLFMAGDGSSFTTRISTLVGTRPDIAGAFVSFSTGTRTYLVVSTIFGLIVAVIDTGAQWAIGIPLPVLWGLLSFITTGSRRS